LFYFWSALGNEFQFVGDISQLIGLINGTNL